MELKLAVAVLLTVAFLSWASLEASWAVSDRNILDSLSLPDGSKPVDICYGDGSIWVLDGGRKTIIKIDGSSRDVVGEFVIPAELPTRWGVVSLSEFKPEEMVWAYGKLWVAGDRLYGAILLFLDPSSGSWGIVDVPRSIYYSYGPVVGAWCVAEGGGRIWALVGTMMGATLLVEVDPHALVATGYSADLPGGRDICYGHGSIWVLYTYVKTTPYGTMEVSRLYAYDIGTGRTSLFTTRPGSFTVAFVRGGRLYIGYAPPGGESRILVFDLGKGEFLGSLRTIPGVYSPVREILVDSRGDIWFSQPGYFGVCGGRVWPTHHDVVAMCEAGDEIWMCSTGAGAEIMIVDLGRGLARLAVRLPSYVLGFPSTAFIPMASGALSVAIYALVDLVLGRVRYKKWLRERRAKLGRAGMPE